MLVVVKKSFAEAVAEAAETEEDLLEGMRDQFSEFDQRMKKIAEAVDDAAAALRMEAQNTRRELTETRAHLARLQNRVDNQLMSMILANIASGVGVAAIMLAATQAI